jgi:hypothetical protein
MTYFTESGSYYLFRKRVTGKRFLPFDLEPHSQQDWGIPLIGGKAIYSTVSPLQSVHAF